MSNKFTRFLVFIYSLFLPFIPMGALAVGEDQSEHQVKERSLPKTENEDNRDNEKELKEDLMAQGLQKVGSLLSSSPSQLTEQAKSYALGKLNSTVTGEAQKWLSQFGTAKINFSMDRKGKLDNSSIDFLLPLYDNKADWLFFSQVGYRNKDSRNTVNFGLGGRYFTPGWMYGLNTFYDYDVTGKNKRMGLGGEAWADYVKLSANTYLRLSDWHQSMEDKDFEERPANGFDLNGEFFLPAYPNLGGKLGYEQYFGDNVSLFNRSTKQKNPSLARFGLSYTPVPLVTMGVDYKHGSGGHSETLFLANLNYRFGVPLGVQLSTDSVASMRTLAGSRYDLVERNNNIVLDYRKKAILEMMLPDTITGYSGEKRQITADIRADEPIKTVTWSADGAFYENKGNIPLEGGQTIDLTLPNYNPKGTNSYEIFAVAEDETGKQSGKKIIRVVVEPISVKTSVTANRPVVADGNAPYTLTVTLSSGKDNHPLSHTEFKEAKWTYEYPGMPTEEDLENLDIYVPKFDSHPNVTNSQGQLIVKLTSVSKAKDIKVYLEIPGVPKILVNKTESISFGQYSLRLTQMESAPKGSVFIKDSNNPNNAHTFRAVVVDAFGAPVDYLGSTDAIKWVTEPNTEVIIQDSSDITKQQGQIFATVQSTKAQTVKVGVVINSQDTYGVGAGQGNIQLVSDAPVYFDPVEFVDDKQELNVTFDFEASSTSLKANGSQYTVAATVTGKDGQPYKDPTVIPVWNIISLPAASGASITAVDSKIDSQGKLKAVLRSTQGIKNARVGLTLNGGVAIQSQLFDFIPEDPSDAVIKGLVEVTPEGPLPADMENKFAYKVLMVDSQNGKPIKNQTFKDISWEVVSDKYDPPDSLKFIDVQNTTDDKGYLTASLVSSAGLDDVDVQVKVTMNINGKPESLTAKAKKVRFNAVEREANLMSHVDGVPNNMVGNPSSLGRPFTVMMFRQYVLSYINYSQSEGGLAATGFFGDNGIIGHGSKFDIKYDVPAGSSIEVKESGSGPVLVFPPEKFKPGPVKVTAKATNKKTGEKYIVSYQFNPKRYILIPNQYVDGSQELGAKNSSCETLEPSKAFGLSKLRSVSPEMLGYYDTNIKKYTFESDYKAGNFFVPTDSSGNYFQLIGEEGGEKIAYLFIPTTNNLHVTGQNKNKDLFLGNISVMKRESNNKKTSRLLCVHPQSII
ncbi:inverse autotransporter beta domain-containing protein [Xenorhabdus khoisanae]|uniref:inverse autotransporter beta domain-containing protein n=1 Tax=Xenorhabdus khoisanae TaxID=880157 RepID=UPI002359DCA9|nr:inverse autotransporter beta domain-containing protein [Xenorhabdus khoisanae]MDC9614704.1 inverse autotransporter beta domain-containing protein [Xenorhabdus khoisanae]